MGWFLFDRSIKYKFEALTQQGDPHQMGAKHRFSRGLKTLVWAEVAPLTDRELGQIDGADTHAFQTHHLQTHLFTHPSDLSLLTLAQNKA